MGDGGGYEGGVSGFPYGDNAEGMNGRAGTGAGGGGVVGVPDSMQGQVSAWLSSLTVNPKGILFEGGPIKVRHKKMPFFRLL